MNDGLSPPRRYLAIGALCLGSALVIIDGGVANVALPTIARDLRVDSSSVVLVVTVYQLMLVMLLLPFAGLGGSFGLKRTYQLGQTIFTIATVLCFFAESLPFLLIVRAAQANTQGQGATPSTKPPIVGAAAAEAETIAELMPSPLPRLFAG